MEKCIKLVHSVQLWHPCIIPSALEFTEIRLYIPKNQFWNTGKIELHAKK